MKKIAILGATSQIAKNLICYLHSDNELFLFSRNVEIVSKFIISNKISYNSKSLSYDIFKDYDYDAVINCIGIADPKKQATNPYDSFLVTEYYDNLIINYLQKYTKCKYVNFSSGAVFGTDHNQGISDSSGFSIMPNYIKPNDAYRVSKLNSETKHRILSNYSIYDIRVFSFFSRYIDLGASFLITELVNSVITNRSFLTNENDIVRDFIHPLDLSNLVKLCINCDNNLALDAYSLSPIKKSEIINLFKTEFNLKVEYSSEQKKISPTGLKSCYYSVNNLAEKIVCYKPKYSSLDCILEEANAILAQ